MGKKRNYKSKYIHFLLANELKFTSRVVNLINDPDNGICSEEHTFITPYVKVYDALKHYGNVELDTQKGNLYNRYGDSCDWIFTHGLLPKRQLLTTRKRILNKIIYRYWGGSRTTHMVLNPRKPLKYLSGKLKIQAFKMIHGSFAAIGIANITDVLDISKILKNTVFYRMPYATKSNFEALKAVKEKPSTRNDGYTNVLLGHRGKDEDNHIELLEMLRKFEDKKMRIYVPLSYGNADYIERVKAYVRDHPFKNVFIIEEFMEFAKYSEFLGDMDIGIFDGVTSYALGNIGMLLYLEKTIYLNRNGIIKEAFDYEKVPRKYIDEIPDMDFSQFIEPVDYEGARGNGLEVHDYDHSVGKWKELLARFN